MKVGIDIGGTFTDFAYIGNDGIVRFSKVLTTYPPEMGLRKGLEELQVSLRDCNFLSHSTTLGLNALVSEKGAKTALVTTRGFRDTLEIGRTRRLFLYDLFQDKPEKILVPRSLRFEVDERLDRYGNVIEPLNLQQVREIARKLKATDVQAIAITLIHSYANSKHEETIAKIFAEECPNMYISMSSQVLPEYREYERTYATTLNAYIGPIMTQYFEITDRIFAESGYTGESFVSQSNGGLMSTKIARTRPVYGIGQIEISGGSSGGPVYTIGSGPASGVIGGIFIGKLTGNENLICMDMGGTTCLCSLVDSGVPKIVSETNLGNRLKLPMIDVKTIGAGGGSIAWMDLQGALHVGPRSAAASPGPACYGLGGKEPTVTDANLLLGMLDEEYYLGGRMKVYRDKSREAIRELADRLGSDIFETAHSIIKIVEANMVNNISEVSVWRGYDPRELTLIAYGGGSGLHCIRMAEELGIKTVVSPPYPAIVSALGHIVSDVKHFFVRSYLKELSTDFGSINEFFTKEENEALTMLRAEIPEASEIKMLRSLDMRYIGQTHEIEIAIANRELVQNDKAILAEKFHERHKELYGYSLENYAIEIVTMRLEAIGVSPSIYLKKKEISSPEPRADAFRKPREVYTESDGVKSIKTYDRNRLDPGNIILGPSIVDGPEATLFVPEGWTAKMDGFSNLVITSA